MIASVLPMGREGHHAKIFRQTFISHSNFAHLKPLLLYHIPIFFIKNTAENPAFPLGFSAVILFSCLCSDFRPVLEGHPDIVFAVHCDEIHQAAPQPGIELLNEILIPKLSLYFLRLPYGANGNHVTSYDLVYDKTTGERIPLENYVRITLTDLKYYLWGHSYDAQGEKLRSINSDYIKMVPDNYFLEGNGVVCLVFQPYQLAAGCFGNCYVRLEPQYIEYLNRKNQW